jgi:hypothetical protein
MPFPDNPLYARLRQKKGQPVKAAQLQGEEEDAFAPPVSIGEIEYDDNTIVIY